MSVRAMAIIFASDLSPYDRLVMLALADSANDEGVCWPSIPKLARKCGMTDRGVQKVMERIDRYIDKQHRVNTSTVYRLRLELLPKPASSGERGSPVNVVHPSPERGSPLVVNGVHPNHKGKRKEPSKCIERAIAEDWQPENVGKKTAEFMATWPPGFLESEVERFIAHHLAHKTKSENFNRQWATWALGPYCREALRKWNDERGSNDRPFGDNALANLAAKHFGGNGGARPARST